MLLLLRDCDKEVEAEGSEEAVGKCRGVVAMVCFFGVCVCVFCVVKIGEIIWFFFIFYILRRKKKWSGEEDCGWWVKLWICPNGSI